MKKILIVALTGLMFAGCDALDSRSAAERWVEQAPMVKKYNRPYRAFADSRPVPEMDAELVVLTSRIGTMKALVIPPKRIRKGEEVKLVQMSFPGQEVNSKGEGEDGWSYTNQTMFYLAKPIEPSTK